MVAEQEAEESHGSGNIIEKFGLNRQRMPPPEVKKKAKPKEEEEPVQQKTLNSALQEVKWKPSLAFECE